MRANMSGVLTFSHLLLLELRVSSGTSCSAQGFPICRNQSFPRVSFQLGIFDVVGEK
jgi:hypothetical protein